MKLIRQRWSSIMSKLIVLAVLSGPMIGHALLFDLLSAAVLGVDWITSNASRAQITGDDQLRLHDGYVEVESQVYDFSEADAVNLNFDVTVPFSLLGFLGAGPSPGEDLRVDFLRDDGNWEELTTFVADSGFLGIISLGGAYSYSDTLPTSAHHDAFQVRYVMEAGGGFLDFFGDNWYISNIEVDADIPPTGPDHFRFAYLSSALTCEPHSVNIQACADAACASLYTDSITMTLSPSGWSGGDTITITGGSTAASLSKTTPGTVTLGVASSTPVSTGGTTQCSIGGGAYSAVCDLTYADAGFVVSIPEFLSGRGDTATIQAVRKSDNSPQCVPAFANISKTLGIWSEYSLPSSGSLSAYVSSPSVAVGQSSGTATSITAAFDGSGLASVPVNYLDAGYVKLNVSYTGSGADAGLNMAGDATLLARPAGMCVQTGGECINPSGGDYANCGIFTQAGATFSLTVSAMAWQADGETDYCDGNTTTPNYNSNGDFVQLGVSLVSPSAGINGSVHLDGNPSSTSYIQATASQAISVNQTEVGVFNFSVTPPLYYSSALGSVGNTSSVTFNSQPTGRFTPDHFEVVVVDVGSVAPSCSTGNVYSGQTTSWLLAPELLISAHSVTDGVTTNYTSTEYLKLDANAVYVAVTPPATDASQVGTDLTLLPINTAIIEGDLSVVSGSPGVMRYVFSAADDITYERSALAEVGSFTPVLNFSIETSMVDSDLIALQPAVPFSPNSSGLVVRFGRLWLEDTYGSDTSNLMMAMRSEYFDGSGYTLNIFDDCTDWDSVNASIDSLSAILPATGTLTDGSSGNAGLILQASSDVPGTPDEGYATVTYTAPAWLTGDYDNNGTYEDPEGKATFGINRGHERLIFRKEVR